jgi:hypothetical protein
MNSRPWPGPVQDERQALKEKDRGRLRDPYVYASSLTSPPGSKLRNNSSNKRNLNHDKRVAQKTASSDTVFVGGEIATTLIALQKANGCVSL